MNRPSSPFHARAALGQAPQSLAGKLLTLLLGGAFLVFAFMFSLIALAVLAVVGAVFAGWMWWKTRALRQAMRDAAPAAGGHDDRPVSAGEVIEGEFIREAGDGVGR